MKKIFFLLSFLYMHFAFGQSLLKSFETSNKSSFPRYGVDVNGTLFFTAGQPLTGEVRVWKTDGTGAGTSKINAATGAPVTGPFPHFAATNAVRAFGNKALIIAAPANQNYDHELWVSDGTEAGTLRLADINPGNGDPYIQYLAVVNLGANTLAFFSADNGTNGQELWMTDGTQAGTVLLKDINPGSASSEPFGFTVFNNSVYFFANNGTNGHELWITDGTSVGTNMLKDIVTGIGSSASPYGTNQIITNDYGMYLVLYDTSYPTNATKLYYSDGTSGNTFSLGGYQYPRNFKKINNRIYFTMNDTYTNLMYIENNGAYVYPFFANLDTGGSVLNAEDLTVSGDTLYLTADYALNERRLYLVNNFIPSIAYTVADIVPSANSNPFPVLAKNRKFIPAGKGKMYFLANNGTNGKELWYTDGNWSNTKMVRDFKPNAADGSYSFMKMFGDKLFFIADTSATAAECYYTQNGNTPVKMSSIDPSKGLSNFYPIAVSGGNLYFSAFDPIVGYELFKTNGTSFTLIKDIYTVNYSMDYTFFRQSVVLNNKLFFTAVDGKVGNEIWSTNGKSNQTKIPFEIYRYPTEEGLTNYSTTYYHYQTSTPIERIYKINSKILIFEGRNIWSSDGTSNPELIFSANNYFSYLNSGLEMNGYLYFDMGNKLYRTDGTAAGTTLMCVPDGTLPNDSRAIKLMDVVDNKVFFAGFHSTYGWEVFSNNGTVGAAVLLMDLTPGYNTTELFHASKTVGNKMYFSIYTATNGIVLYVTQGTSANTTLLKVFGFSTQGPLFMTNFNNTHLVFNGEEGTTGRELWKSDGTPAGTVMIKDIHPTAGSNPRNDLYNKQFAVYNNYVFFGATNATTSGLYRSDLTAAGTEYISQYEGFTALSTPHGVYMYGYSPATGNEPYKVEFDGASRRLVSDIYPGTYTSNPYDFHLLGDLIFVHTFDTQQKKQIHVFRTCLNTTQLSGNQNSSATTYAMDQVHSTANLGASTSQIFSAGKSILLEPGFKTNAQTVFETKLNGCFYSTQN